MGDRDNEETRPRNGTLWMCHLLVLNGVDIDWLTTTRACTSSTHSTLVQPVLVNQTILLSRNIMFNFLYSVLNILIFKGTGNWTQDPTHGRQELYHWANSQPWQWFFKIHLLLSLFLEILLPHQWPPRYPSLHAAVLWRLQWAINFLC